MNNRFVKISFLSPSMVLFIIIAFVPFIYMIILSFQDYSLAIPEKNGAFIGFDNYKNLFLNNSSFYKVLLVSLIFILSTVTIESVLGLLIANFLFENITNKFIIPILAIPMMLAPVTVGLMWLLLFQGEYGLLDYLFNKIGLFNNTSILSNPDTALIAIIIVDIWEWTPFVALILYTGLIALPKEPIESAKIDGASGLQIFKDIKVPMLVPIFLVTIFIRFIDTFKEFDKVFIMTGGGPGNETELFSIFGWRLNFRNWDIGYGAAYVTIIYLVIIIITYLFFKLLLRNTSK